MVKSFTAYKHTVRGYPGVIFVHRLVANVNSFLEGDPVAGGRFGSWRVVLPGKREKSEHFGY